MAARFFCDHCGTEVERNSNRCPRCGRIFAFVRCPQCGFTGEESLFKKGCPGCGYCAPAPRQGEAPDWPGAGARPVAAGKLPPWVYILAALALAAVTGALLFLISG
ncbi:MAG: zinc-ribbon domain-containing protein [Spirochaetaceae bacterium]|nr:zinc-ribbon domain-containing protein [Spirochaetaceae bacterium]